MYLDYLPQLVQADPLLNKVNQSKSVELPITLQSDDWCHLNRSSPEELLLTNEAIHSRTCSKFL